MYSNLEEVVKSFFFALKLPKKSLIVFDGGLPFYKRETRLSRNVDKVALLEIVFKSSMESSSDIYARNCAVALLPPFAIECAANVLKKMQFEVLSALEEADELIAHFAIKQSCPVLSLDSDFLCALEHFKLFRN